MRILKAADGESVANLLDSRPRSACHKQHPCAQGVFEEDLPSRGPIVRSMALDMSNARVGGNQQQD